MCVAVAELGDGISGGRDLRPLRSRYEGAGAGGDLGLRAGVWTAQAPPRYGEEDGKPGAGAPAKAAVRPDSARSAPDAKRERPGRHADADGSSQENGGKEGKEGKEDNGERWWEWGSRERMVTRRDRGADRSREETSRHARQCQ